MIRVIRLVVLQALFCTSIGSCTSDSSNQAEDNRSTTTEYPELSTQEEYKSLDDSTLLEGVDPEEIITDDWSDDGDLELDVSE